MKFLFPMVVWGADYVSEFLEQSLPTQLAFGNLGDFEWLEGSKYLILTTGRDRKAIEASPIFQRLQRLMEVEFVDIGKIPRHNKYIGASLAQLEALKRSRDYDGIFFLYPDFVCATGTIQNAARRIAEGWDAVVAPIPAVLGGIFDDELTTRNEVITPTTEGQIIAFPPRLLAEVAMKHFHPMISGYVIGGDKSNIGPAYIIWEVPEEGLVFRCFHLHPIVIRVQRDNPYYLTEFNVSLDEEYVPRLFRSCDRIYFPKDSDEFAMCSIRTPDSQPQPIDAPISLLHIAHWAEEYASLVHREFVGTAFRWHANPIEDESVWEEVEAESLETVDAIRDRLLTPDSILRYEDEEGYFARARRRGRFDFWRKPVFHEFVVTGVEEAPADGPQPSPLLLWMFRVIEKTGLKRFRNVPGVRPVWVRIRTRLTRPA